MKIIGIDSSGMVASVAYLADGVVVAEYTTDFKQTHSQTLLPMLDEMCQRIELELNTIDAIAISGGPGSFTGLRIGSATAKGLGLALHKPLIHVPTLAAMAYQCFGWEGLICPMMDARRNQVFTGFYRIDIESGKLQTVKDSFAEDIQAVLQMIPGQAGVKGDAGGAGKHQTVPCRVAFLGDGAILHKEKIAEVFPDAVFMPCFANKQRAAVVAALGEWLYLEGNYEDAGQHAPDYLRVSQAERERAEKMRKQGKTER